MLKITLLGETPSLKNSKRIVMRGKRPIIIPSKHYQDWAEAVRWQLKQVDSQDWQYPIKVDFHFYRKTRRRFDYINLAQGPLDMLVEAGILPDDDMNHIIPGAFSWSVDKQNPRCELTIKEIE